MTDDLDELPPSTRQWIEFLLVLFIATAIFKTFVTDGYFVPTGSMAPGLLGVHNTLHCPSCKQTFVVGRDDDAWSPPNLICPSCRSNIPIDEPIDQPGDRLLVLKGYYEWRQPRRWETAVFLNPNDAGEAYVKRIVGLPNETILVHQGDIYANGQICRKSPPQYRSIALPVYDSTATVRHADPHPVRWLVDGDQAAVEHHDRGWTIDTRTNHSISTLSYQDHDAAGFPIPIRDDLPYNATRLGPTPKPITDLSIRAAIHFQNHQADDALLTIRLRPINAASFSLQIYPSTGQLQLILPSQSIPLPALSIPPSQAIEVELGFWDASVSVHIDGRLLGTFPTDPLPNGSTPALQPVQLEFEDLSVKIDRIQIDRDIYYRSDASRSWVGRNPQGFQLGHDEYFMLGDNSAVSNDSRSWNVAGISRRLLIGKPVFVHLPMRAGRGKMAGRTWQWNWPDWQRIRRIDPW
jgi:signal peptidase I